MPTLKKQKIYANVPRTISVHSIEARHPLGVRPLGNMLFAEPPQGLSKQQQMGHFHYFPEDVLMFILSLVDSASSLKALSHTSRVLYAYVYDEDLWKQLYLHQIQKLETAGHVVPELTWRGSWRLSVLKLNKSYLADLSLPNNLLCSDLLYRPFQCAQIEYEHLFSKIIAEEETYHLDSLKCNFKHTLLPHGRIPRLSESTLTQEDFDTVWNTKPFILTNNSTQRWPRWNLQALLSRFSGVKFRQEAVQWPLSLYAQYLAGNFDESPLYLFDCRSEAMCMLKKEYLAPEIFKQDLFPVFGNCRPDHAWLIIGSKRSGSTFHKDPNYTSAWNTALSGRKLWVMLPPGVTPPGVSTDEDESEVTSPVGIAEWVLAGFYNDAVAMPEAQIAITFPGECMYVPSGWWHTVINIDDSVALTQNFVPNVKLANALHFLKSKRAQISGFKPAEVRKAIADVVGKDLHEDELSEELGRCLQVIREYGEKFDSCDLKSLEDEDCGEILESQLPVMPVFELFQLLLFLDGKKELLSDALARLQRKEKSELAKITGKSEAWQKLTETSSGGFSFGFTPDEDDE